MGMNLQTGALVAVTGARLVPTTVAAAGGLTASGSFRDFFCGGKHFKSDFYLDVHPSFLPSIYTDRRHCGQSITAMVYGGSRLCRVWVSFVGDHASDIGNTPITGEMEPVEQSLGSVKGIYNGTGFIRC